MLEEDNTWIISMTTGMALTVIGVTMLETAMWFIQYAALGAGLVMAVFSLYQAQSQTTPE